MTSYIIWKVLILHRERERENVRDSETKSAKVQYVDQKIESQLC